MPSDLFIAKKHRFVIIFANACPTPGISYVQLILTGKTLVLSFSKPTLSTRKPIPIPIPGLYVSVFPEKSSAARLSTSSHKMFIRTLVFLHLQPRLTKIAQYTHNKLNTPTSALPKSPVILQRTVEHCAARRWICWN